MRRLAGSWLWALVGVWLTTGVASAQVPHLVRYQGTAEDSQGVALEGPYTLTFRLYTASTAGTKVWEEQQSAVQIEHGNFTVLLGSVTQLNVDWSQTLWLSIQINADPELSPRQQITSVPLALRAETAEQLATPVTTSNITDDANLLVPSGAIVLWTGASCPAGYSRLSALDGKFLVSGSTFVAAAGGSNTKDISHTHGAGSYAGPSHTHSVPRDGWGRTDIGPGFDGRLQVSRSDDQGYSNVTATGNNTSGAGGTGAVTGISASGGSSSFDIRPAFATVLLCQKN